MTNSTQTLPELLSLKQTAEVLHCHPNTLRLWDKNGILKAVRFGKRGDRKYRRHDVLEVLRTNQYNILPEVRNVTHNIDFFHSEFATAARRIERLEIITELLTQSIESKEISEIVLTHMLSAMNAQSGHISLLKQPTNVLEIIFSLGYKKNELKLWNNLPITSSLHCSETVKSGKPIIIESITESEIKYNGTKHIADKTGHIAFISLPIATKKKMYGVISINFNQPARFSEQDRMFLLALAHQCSQAIERVQLYEVEKQALEQALSTQDLLEKIYQASLKLLKPVTLRDTYKSIVNEALQLTGGKYGSIFLNRDTLRRIYTTNESLYKIIPRHLGRTYQAFNTNKASYYHVKNKREPHPELEGMGIKTVIYIPLTNSHTIGVLNILVDTHITLSDKHLSILNLFGSMASMAILKAQLYEQEKHARETRDLFISMAAHELKSPLTAIHSYIQLLLNKIQKKELPKLQWVEELESSSRRLNSLFDELLHKDVIQSGKLHFSFRSQHLSEIIKRTVREFTSNHPDRKIKVQQNIRNDLLLADSSKLIQAFINILNNAVKFSPVNSLITIHLSQKNDKFIIKFKDEGKGISPTDLPHVFERFYKGEEENEGLGLGLFLTKKIIEQHEGTIELSSKLNVGTVITISLPQL